MTADLLGGSSAPRSIGGTGSVPSLYDWDDTAVVPPSYSGPKSPPKEAADGDSSFMRSSTKDKIKGTLQEAKGKVKEESGKAVGNPDLQDRGTGEKVAGKVQKKIGDIKKVFGK